MLFKATYELFTVQCHLLLFIAIRVIFIGKGYRIILLINTYDPMVTDGYLMVILPQKNAKAYHFSLSNRLPILPLANLSSILPNP